MKRKKTVLVMVMLALGLAGCFSSGTSDADRALVCKEVSDLRGMLLSVSGLTPEEVALVNLWFDTSVADVNSAILGEPLRPDVGKLSSATAAKAKKG